MRRQYGKGKDRAPLSMGRMGRTGRTGHKAPALAPTPPATIDVSRPRHHPSTKGALVRKTYLCQIPLANQFLELLGPLAPGT